MWLCQETNLRRWNPHSIQKLVRKQAKTPCKDYPIRPFHARLLLVFHACSCDHKIPKPSPFHPSNCRDKPKNNPSRTRTPSKGAVIQIKNNPATHIQVLNSLVLSVYLSSFSSKTSTPIPGPVGTLVVPSAFSLNSGSTISSLK